MATTPTRIALPVHPADLFLNHGHMGPSARHVAELAAKRSRWDDVVHAPRTTFGEVVVPTHLVMDKERGVIAVVCGGSNNPSVVGTPWATQVEGIHLAIAKVELPRIDFLGRFHTWLHLKWDDDTSLLEGCLPEFDIRRARSTIPDEPPYAVFIPGSHEVPSWDEWVGSLR